MGTEGNKFSNGTSFQPAEPKLCANGCGFFGAAATMNLCSKCYRDLRVTEEQAASAKASMDKLVNPNPVLFSADYQVGDSSSAIELPTVIDSVAPVEAKAANRCSSCNKKVGVMGFKCRCGSTFCGAHRYPEKHECSFDFKGSGRDAISRANPVVKADKVEKF